jgi:hypothetical protein
VAEMSQARPRHQPDVPYPHHTGVERFGHENLSREAAPPA